jgi:hypothetical protein
MYTRIDREVKEICTYKYFLNFCKCGQSVRPTAGNFFACTFLQLWNIMKAEKSAPFDIHFNHFLFFIGLICPRSSCLKLTTSGITYSLLPVSCGDIGF